MERKTKLEFLRAVESGLPIKIALRAVANEHIVLFDKGSFYTSRMEGGEIVTIDETKLLQKHFPKSIFISPFRGISFDPEQ